MAARKAKKRNRTIIKAKRAVIVKPNPRAAKKKTPTAKQLAARRRFAALARKRSIAAKKKSAKKKKTNPTYTAAQMLRGDAGHAAKRFAESVMDYARRDYPTSEAKMELIDAGLDAGASPMVIKRLLAKKMGRATATRLVNLRVQQRTRRNPDGSAATKRLYQKFGGKPSRKTTTLLAPNGTPKNVAKLGRLRKIKLTDGRAWAFAGNAAPYLAADSKGRLHVVGGRYRANPASTTCGQVAQIEYETTKPHLGHHSPTIYFHKMGEETGDRPTMAIDHEGLIKLRGGAYRIEADGIHN